MLDLQDQDSVGHFLVAVDDAPVQISLPHLQCLLSVHDQLANVFQYCRYNRDTKQKRELRTQAFAAWSELNYAQMTASVKLGLHKFSLISASRWQVAKTLLLYPREDILARRIQLAAW